jgi:hypothetical protein
MACGLEHCSFWVYLKLYDHVWASCRRRIAAQTNLAGDVRTNTKARHRRPTTPHCKQGKQGTRSFTANHTPVPPAASHILASALMFGRSPGVLCSLIESHSAVIRLGCTRSPSSVARAASKTPFPPKTYTTSSPTMAPTPSRAIVISGPSGAGKSTILKRLFEEYPDRFGFSVSHTTRAPRGAEQDGVEYNFVTKEQFADLVEKKGFVEHATFGSNSYGTSIAAIEAIEKKGRTCILDIEMEVCR